MNNISDLLNPDCIKLELTARSSKELAIKELVQLLAAAGKLNASDDAVSRYTDDVMAREKISSTGIGNGIAIPHVLVAEAKSITMALGRSAKGVPFESVDGKPAHLIFLIIGPQGQNNEYLKILSKLSRYLNDRGFFEALMKVETPAEVIDLVTERER
ncbi:MAG: PTS sugar transporter subunit IIA [Chitinispirillales bacterium]|jgi:mannitol/fructose-specific phosphotransferase system IIA component (Ntr-type)|nr:PTS sugar transporter subunit IIA [Chitinispirillales bacterium]